MRAHAVHALVFTNEGATRKLVYGTALWITNERFAVFLQMCAEGIPLIILVHEL